MFFQMLDSPVEFTWSNAIKSAVPGADLLVDLWCNRTGRRVRFGECIWVDVASEKSEPFEDYSLVSHIQRLNASKLSEHLHGQGE